MNSLGSVLVCVALAAMGAGRQSSPVNSPAIVDRPAVLELRITESNGDQPEGEVLVVINGKVAGQTQHGHFEALVKGEQMIQVRLTRMDRVQVLMLKPIYLPAGVREIIPITSHRRWFQKDSG